MTECCVCVHAHTHAHARTHTHTRVHTQAQMVKVLLETGMTEVLHANDQLRIQMCKAKVKIFQASVCTR